MNRVNLFNIIDYCVKAHEYYKNGGTGNSSYDEYRPFIAGTPVITTAVGTKKYDCCTIIFLYGGRFIGIDTMVNEVNLRIGTGFSEAVACNAVMSQMAIVDKITNKITFIDVESIIEFSFV